MTHEHAFMLVGHVDGCHWFSTSGVCECGASIYQYAERDMREDPYAAVWMEDHREHCSRCAELMSGAVPEAPRNEVTDLK